jgi:hypothetical protein
MIDVTARFNRLCGRQEKTPALLGFVGNFKTETPQAVAKDIARVLASKLRIPKPTVECIGKLLSKADGPVIVSDS